jgi:hypothetical protein
MTRAANWSDQWKQNKAIANKNLHVPAWELYLEVNMLFLVRLNVASRSSYSRENLTIERRQFSWAVVTYTYNPSYLGSWDQKNHGSMPAQANS